MPVDGSTFLTTASVSCDLPGLAALMAPLSIFMPAISSAATAALASVRAVQNTADTVTNFFIGFLQIEFAAQACQWVLREVEAVPRFSFGCAQSSGVAAAARRPG